jgi:hypothetical protein
LHSVATGRGSSARLRRYNMRVLRRLWLLLGLVTVTSCYARTTGDLKVAPSGSARITGITECAVLPGVGGDGGDFVEHGQKFAHELYVYPKGGHGDYEEWRIDDELTVSEFPNIAMRFSISRCAGSVREGQVTFFIKEWWINKSNQPHEGWRPVRPICHATSKRSESSVWRSGGDRLVVRYAGERPIAAEFLLDEFDNCSPHGGSLSGLTQREHLM